MDVTTSTDSPSDYPELLSATYGIPTLAINDEPFAFGYLASFIAFLAPYDVHVVYCILELLRDVINAKVSIVQLMFEALKVESGFICLIAIVLIVSVIPFVSFVAWLCSRGIANERHGDSGGDECVMADRRPLPSSENLVNPYNGHNGNGHIGPPIGDGIFELSAADKDAIQLRRRIFAGLLECIICLVICTTIAMFITNHRVSSGIARSPDTIRTSLNDVGLFVKNTEKQIINTLQDNLSATGERLKVDLEDIDKLLGEPIQSDLASNTGIEIAFESIFTICTTNRELIHRIQILQDTVTRALQMSEEASTRLEELQLQLSVLQHQCTARDRPLCDTLRLKSYNEMGIGELFRKLNSDTTLIRMLDLGDTDINGVRHNLSSELHMVRHRFRNYPLHVFEYSAHDRAAIMRQVDILQSYVAHTATKTLTTVSQTLTDSLDRFWHNSTVDYFDWLCDVGESLWLSGLAASILTMAITCVMAGAISCVCTDTEQLARVTLIVASFIVSLASFALLIFTVMIMLLGAHGEIFLCRPFYDDSHYTILGRLFDKPGLVFANELPHGLIAELLQPIGANRTGIHVPLADVLKQCEQNHASYKTFQLEHLLNVSHLTSYREYPEFVNSIERIQASDAPLTSLTVQLQIILAAMLRESDINLTQYRMEISQPTPEKDLATFTDQMQRVSLQIQDTATSSRMTTLGSRARRLQASMFQPLEKIRSDILYHLTALELQRAPWSTHVNMSLDRLSRAQQYFDRDAGTVYDNRTQQYRLRLVNHLEMNRENLQQTLDHNTAECRPLFDVFDANRFLLCQHTIDPLNGLWFTSFLCLLLWAIGTPVSLALASIIQRLELTKRFRYTNTHHAPADNLIISEQSNWGPARTDTAEDVDRSNW